LGVEDYEAAALASNDCRAAGVSGSAVDFLICAVALRRNWPVFTMDHDFTRYARHLPLRLHQPRPKAWEACTSRCGIGWFSVPRVGVWRR